MVLKDPPLTNIKDVINLLSHSSVTGVPSPVVHLWPLEPSMNNSQPSGSRKVQKETIIGTPCIRTMSTDTVCTKSALRVPVTILVTPENKCFVNSNGLL